MHRFENKALVNSGRFLLMLGNERNMQGKTMSMQFGIMMRGQFPQGDNVADRFAEMMEQARMAETLGYHSITKGAHYSTHPLQDLQQVPFLCRVAAEAPSLRLNTGVLLLPAAQAAGCCGAAWHAGYHHEWQADLRLWRWLPRCRIGGLRYFEGRTRQPVRGESDGHQAAVDRGNGHHEGVPF